MDVYICQKCGKEFETPVKFCSECAGKVSAYSTDVIKFVCSKCGKEYPEKWNFCHDCAGRIVTTVPYSYVCAACKATYPNEVKFCPECGGKIQRFGGVLGQDTCVNEQEAVLTVETKNEPVEQSGPTFCPGCGQNTLENGFCSNCGFSNNK